LREDRREDNQGAAERREENCVFHLSPP
jgi:hypothetical protein